jgi:DNA-binding response OmpR family regulator
MAITNTILIIDDEINLRRSLALILERSGYQVSLAANALEAMLQLKTRSFDLTFLDLKLPDRDGISLLPQIRSEYPNMPVLILTAHATLETAIRAVRAGARDYLLKPLDPPLILKRVREIFLELEQPKRKREIASQIQTLLSELQQVDHNMLPGTILPGEHPTDPTRVIALGPLSLDIQTRRVSLRDRNVTMPPSAFNYLVTLVKHSPEPVPYITLVLESQGYKDLTRAEAREITRWQIHELRKALEDDPRHPAMIFTVRDIGYRLVT